jgi:hypothetical protein
MNAPRTLKILLPTLLALASLLPLSAQQIQIGKDNKTIAITTTDDASALADTAIVTIGFDSYGKDQDTTYADATETSNAIVSAITTSGIPKDAIQSQEQNLTPLNPSNFQDKPHYDEGLRFQFTQRWQVTVPADQAAKLLQLAITHGANNSGGIQWQLQHDDTLQAEAAQKALHHARDIAASMAQGLGVQLGPLLYASNQAPAPRVFGMAAMAGMAGGNVRGRALKPLAISPERITRSATVYAVFAIE